MMRILLLLLLALPLRAQDLVAPILLTAPAGAPAVVFGEENVVSTTGSGASTTQAFTVTNADLIIVCVTATWAAPTGVTFNGDALTEQTSREYSGYGSFIYTRANPDVGTYNVVVSFAGATDATVTIIGYKKTHNSTPVTAATENEGTGTAVSTDVSSASGSVVIDCLGWYNWIATATAAGGQTEKSNQTVGDIGGAVSVKSGATTTNMAWTISTSREWSHTAISVNPE